MNCKLIFDEIVDSVRDYVEKHNLQSMVLGISGGIDSTVVAAICREVYRKTGVPFIGRSLPMKNSDAEVNAATKVGQAFCSNFKEVALGSVRESFLRLYESEDNIKDMTLLADGNIQARLRMIYLYNIAGLTKGIVMDTDNATEHLCGFWTKHGDEGDIKPIGRLFKTEIFELTRYLVKRFVEEGDTMASEAVQASLALKPTDGLGIADGDEAQLGAPYSEVDDILVTLFNHFPPIEESDNLEEMVPELIEKYGDKVYNILGRYKATNYKRLGTPTVPIERLEGADTIIQKMLEKNDGRNKEVRKVHLDKQVDGLK